MIPLNEQCTQRDICEDPHGFCKTGFCRCKEGYFEKEGVCGESLFCFVIQFCHSRNNEVASGVICRVASYLLRKLVRHWCKTMKHVNTIEKEL